MRYRPKTDRRTQPVIEVLGGPLFDIFIDDIRQVVMDALVLLFADDTKAALKIESEEDGAKMQKIIEFGQLGGQMGNVVQYSEVQNSSCRAE